MRAWWSGEADADAAETAEQRVGLAAKEQGNALFRAKDLAGALERYTHGIESFPFGPDGRPAVVIETARPEDNVLAVLLSNRSAALAGLGRPVEALRDARLSVQLEKNWPRAHERMAKALTLLQRHKDAAQSFAKAATLEAAARKKDEERHKRELDALTKQSAGAQQALDGLLEENKRLRQQLQDYELVFGGTAAKKQV